MTLSLQNLSGLHLRTVRYRKVILGRDRLRGVGVQHHVTLFPLKVSLSLYCVTSVSHVVLNYFPGLWGMGITDALFLLFCSGNSVILFIT